MTIRAVCNSISCYAVDAVGNHRSARERSGHHTAEPECWFHKPMKIVDAMPHMHALGTRFFAGFVRGQRDTELWLDDRGFDEASDIYSYDPAVDLG